MLLITNIIPIIGIKKLLSVNMLIAPINPPNEREPVSPIKTLALLTLKVKKPNIAPIKHALSNCKFSYSSTLKYNTLKFSHCNIVSTIINIKYTALTCPAKPSNPSVKLTLFVIARKITIIVGMVKKPRFT